MTTDFAEDFIEACDKEDEPYLIVYRASDGGFRVRWSTGNDEDLTERDFIDVVNACLTVNE